MADEELGGGWRYEQEPKGGKLRWKSAEEKSVSQLTEAVSSPLTGLLEALQFWHLLGDVCFCTLVADVLRLCQTAPSAPSSSVWTGDVRGSCEDCGL